MYNNYPQQEIGNLAKKQTPYMQELTEQMDVQLKRLEEYITRAGSAVDRISAIPKEPGNQINKQEPLPGYIGTISSRLDILRSMTERLEHIVYHLETFA